MDINTCYETTNYYHTVAYYSHLLPTALALFLSIYALLKTKFSKLSIAFFAFTFGFSLWLIGSLVDWVSSNYGYVYFTWSWLDLVNIVFFVSGAYFFGLLARGRVSNWEKVLFVVLCLPAFWITIAGNSLLDFYQPVCEATESNFLTNYKLIAEVVIVGLMSISFALGLKGAEKKKKIRLFVVLAAIIAFFVVFSFTEYIATVTNVYEINLYGLFVLPLFLIVIVFAITNLGMFGFRFLGTQILAYALILMSGSQFLFLQDSAEKTLTSVTLVISIMFGFLLLQNAKRESEARQKIEQLAKDLQITNTKLAEANTRLEELNKQKSEFVSFATHQLRSPLTAMGGYTSMMLEGDYGQLSDKAKDVIKTIGMSTRTLATVVDSYLNVSRIELGTMKYEMAKVDLKEMLEEVLREQKPNIESKGLAISVEGVDSGEKFVISADLDKFKQVLMNTVDNSIKYTPKGSLTVSLSKTGGKIRFMVKDTGIGIDPIVMPKLFQKYSRAPKAGEANIHGTGLGLYIASEIVKAHGGKMWAESDGEGKGSRFIIEVPEAKSE